MRANFNPLPSCEGETCGKSAPFRAYYYFNPLPSCEGRLHAPTGTMLPDDFNPLPSCEGRQICSTTSGMPSMHFNPLPSCEGRPSRATRPARTSTFQSTPLMRGETRTRGVIAMIAGRFQSTPLMRGETKRRAESLWQKSISIHSPHARGDHTDCPYNDGHSISIHSPHARGDSARDIQLSRPFGFQSTPLMRGETI